MFDINMYNLSDLPNKVTYCNWRIGMVFNGTENFKLSHNNYIFNFYFQSDPGMSLNCAPTRVCRKSASRPGYVVKVRTDPGYVVKQCPRIVMNKIFDWH